MHRQLRITLALSIAKFTKTLVFKWISQVQHSAYRRFIFSSQIVSD